MVSAAGPVEAVQGEALRVPHHGKEIATETTRRRLHECERRVDGDRCVDCAAALLEHIDADLHRERMGGGDHAVARHGHRAGGEGASLGSVRSPQQCGRGDGCEDAGDPHHWTHGSVLLIVSVRRLLGWCRHRWLCKNRPEPRLASGV
jgi:hypothetical protein